MSLLWQDFLYAFRVLFKRPGPTFLAILALSLSIGLTTTAFSVFNGIFFKGFPHPDGPRLYYIGLSHLESGNRMMALPQSALRGIEDEASACDEICSYYMGTINFSGDERAPKRVDGTYITANFLKVVREPVLYGKPFHQLSPDELSKAVLLSYELWNERYQGSPDVIGRKVRINGNLMTICGVMPKGFVFPLYTEVWTVLDPDTANGEFSEINVMAVGRLKEKATVEELRAQLKRASEALPTASGKDQTMLDADVFGLRPIFRSGSQSWLGIQFAVMGVLLLIACANVANLLLGRAAARGRELAVRAALGASRRRLIMQLLSESLVLAVLGAVGGLIFALWQVDFDMRSINTELPAWLSFDLDARVYGFVAVLVVFVALMAGIIPAFQASRVELNEMLKDGARTSTSFRITTFTKILTVGQIAFSCALLFGAGLAAQHFQRLSEAETSFVPNEILTLRLGLFEQDYPSEESRDAFVQHALERIEAIPGVASVAATSWISEWSIPNSWVPFQLFSNDPANPIPSTIEQSSVEWVTPGYFKTYQADMIEGREFIAADSAAIGIPVAIVNQSFVDQFLSGERSVIGRRIDLYLSKDGDAPVPTAMVIVGVSKNLFSSPLQTESASSPPQVYLPLNRETPVFLTLLARTTSGDAHSLSEPIQAAIQGIDPHLPPYFVRTMQEYFTAAFLPTRMFVSLLLVVSTIALFLAAVGVYSLMAFSVSLRRQEFGVRMAIGAQRHNLVRMVLNEGLTQLGVGIMLGLGLAILFGFALSDALRAILEPDPALLSIILGVLTLATLLALLVPLRRTARLSPMEALRYE